MKKINTKKIKKMLIEDGVIDCDITYKGEIIKFEINDENKKRNIGKYVLPVILLVLILSVYYGIQKVGLKKEILKKDVKVEKTEVKIIENIDLKKDKLIEKIIKKKEESIRSLLERKKYIDVYDKYGWTALHWAEFKGNRNIIKLLKEKGADENKKTLKKWYIFNKGITAEEIGKLSKDFDIVKRKSD